MGTPAQAAHAGRAKKKKPKRIPKGERLDIRGEIINGILAGKSYRAACFDAGTSPDTMYIARREDPEFDEQVKAAIETRGELSVMRSHTLDEEGKQALVEYVRKHRCRPTKAAEALNVSASTITKVRREDPDFDAALTAAQRHLDDIVEDALMGSCLKGNTKAIEIWLYNRRPERWAPQRILERRVIEATAQEAARAEAAKVAEDEGADHEMSREEKVAAVNDLAKKWAERVPEDAPVLRLVVND